MSSAGGALIVFAKQPAPGKVKTRLCPPFTPEQAAAFYAAMLADVLEATAAFAVAHALAPILAIDPPEAVATFEAQVPEGFRVIAQEGPDLGARMAAATSRAFAEGYAPVLLRGSDSPTMGAETIGLACEALARSDVVVCPDLDGGYNLVGLAQPAVGIFEHEMSTATVLDETLARAVSQDLTCERLPPGFDVDDESDLALLRTLYVDGKTQHCLETFRFLEDHAFWVDQSATDD